MPLTFPPRLNLAQRQTPLQPLERLSQMLGGPKIWVKRDDLTGSHLSGNKVRKLEFVIAQAKAEGCDTLITCGGLQSNHCRATALLGAQLGMKVHLILRGKPPEEIDGNLLLDQLAGAEVNCYSVKEYQQDLDGLFERWAGHYSSQGRKAFKIPTGASDEIGIWGYIDCARELKSDFEEQGITPELIVCATGSAGTQAGLSAGSTIYDLGAEVLGMAVSDDEAYFQRRVIEDISRWQKRYQIDIDINKVHIQTDDRYLGPGYGVAGEEVFDTIRLLASTEGLILDPVYTGKAFTGLVDQIKQGHWSSYRDIVFIHTGGIFGLFPQRSALQEN